MNPRCLSTQCATDSELLELCGDRSFSASLPICVAVYRPFVHSVGHVLAPRLLRFFHVSFEAFTTIFAQCECSLKKDILACVQKN